LVSFQLLSA
jgi:gelsolin